MVLAPLALQCLGLQRAQLPDPGDRKIEQRVELVAPEGMALGRALRAPAACRWLLGP